MLQDFSKRKTEYIIINPLHPTFFYNLKCEGLITVTLNNNTTKIINIFIIPVKNNSMYPQSQISYLRSRYFRIYQYKKIYF